MPRLHWAHKSEVLERVADVVNPDLYPIHLVLGMTGAGKSMLIRDIVARTGYADRVAVLDPKLTADNCWTISSADLGPAPKPVIALEHGFGRAAEGGGPGGRWFRLLADRDDQVTTERFTAALKVVRDEGACLLVLEDGRTLSNTLNLRAAIEPVVLTGRESWISSFISTQDLGYVVARDQASFRWIGQTGSRSAAKAACGLLDISGRQWEDLLMGLTKGEWIYHDEAPGNPGPVLFRSWQP